MAEKLYKVSELAEILEVNPQTLYRQIEQGGLKYYRIGKAIRLPMPKPKERTKQCLTKETR